MSQLAALGLALALAAGLAADEPTPEAPPLAGKTLDHWVGELKADDPLAREEAIEVLAGAGPAAKTALPALQKLLDDPDKSIRARAALALWKIGGPSEPVTRALTANLPSASLAVRVQAVNTLGAMGKDAAGAADILLGMLDDPNASVRSRASSALNKFGPAALPALVKSLSHKEVARRRLAAAQFRTFAPQAGEVRPALRGALGDEDLQVRVDVARALWTLGDRDEPVVAALAEGVAKGEPPVQNLVLNLATGDARYQSGDDARKLVPVIEAGLKVEDPSRRVLAAQALYQLQGDKDRVLPLYLEALESPSPGVWAPAVRALADLGADARPALPRLVELLKENTPYAHDLGNALGRIGKPAAAPVAGALKDDPKNFRLHSAAVRVFQVIGPPALPELLPLLKHPDRQVQALAVGALQTMGPAAEPAVPELIAFLDGPNTGLQRTATSTLQRIGPGAKKAVPALVKLAREAKFASLRLPAAQALADIHPQAKEVGALGEELLKDPNPGVRLVGLEVLVKHNPEDPDLLPRARELLKDPRLRRDMVAGLLGRMGPPAAGAVPDLAELLKDPNPVVRFQVALALGQIGPGARPAVPELLKALQDERADRNLREAGLRALAQIGGEADKVVPVVTGMLQDKSSYENRLIADVLAGYGPEAKSAGPRLAEVARALADKPPFEFFHVLEALIRVDPERARKDATALLRPQLSSRLAPHAARLLLLIDEKDEDARRALAEALEGPARQSALVVAGGLGGKGKDYLPEVEKALDDPSPPTRVAAAFSRWQITGQSKTSLDVLLDVLAGAFKDEKMLPARAYAARQLAEMGAAAEQALPALREAALHDPSANTRSAAAYAASRIEAALKARKSD